MENKFIIIDKFINRARVPISKKKGYTIIGRKEKYILYEL